MKYNDDEIQFLGGEDVRQTPERDTRHPASRRWWMWIAALVIVMLSATAVYFWREAHRYAVSFEYPLSRTSAQIIHDLESMPEDTVHGVTMKTDSLYGVGMRLFELHGLTATLAQEAPADTDSTVYLAVHAWDYYWDESKHYRYIGDFVANGNDLASGYRKAGFVAIVGNKWQIGISQEDSVKTYVKQHHGSMFRQFALVSAGQICLKQFALKGKVSRNALARKAGSSQVWYVETTGKESLYDFAQALADYGFTDAIYLTGGNTGNTYYRFPSGEIVGQPNWKEKPYNLIVFRNSRQ